MKRLVVSVLGCLLLTPSITVGQTAAEAIERALLPLSGRAREGAAVVRWKADYTWETLKEGTNTWVCYERSGDPAEAPFAVQCTSKANLPRVAQNRRLDAQGKTPEERAALVTAAAANGTRVDAEFGSMFVSLSGNDRASATIHTTIAVPFATGKSTGLPENGRGGGAFVMAAGTSEAHIMVPGR